MKRITQISLLFFVAVALIFWAWGRFLSHPQAIDKPDPLENQNVSTDITKAKEHIVVVTYFTSDVRCKSCLKIERMTRQTIMKVYGNEVANGKLVFQTLNMDHPENQHFSENYQLSFKTVVISDRWNDVERSWEKMDKVWKLLNDPDAFRAYLSESIKAKLEEVS